MLRLGGDHPIGYFLSTGPTGPTGPQRAPTGPFGHAVFAHSLTQETQEQLKTMREKLSEQNDNHQKSLRKLKGRLTKYYFKSVSETSYFSESKRS